MQKTVTLKAIKREKTGKQYAKKLLHKKTVPAIVYGKGMNPIPLEIDGRELEAVLHSGAGENAVISLKIEGVPSVKEKTVLIREIQQDPVSDRIRHVDFHTISLTEKLRVNVPLVEKGEAPGIKEGGVIDHVHREIEVECLPTEIPNRVEISIEGLQIGGALYVKDIVLPRGVECTLDPEEKILSVLAPMKEEVPAAAPAEEAPQEPELIKKERKEKEEKEEAAGAPSAPAKGEKEEKK